MTKRLAISRGRFTILDDEDFDRASQYEWSARGDEPYCYAARQIAPKGERSVIMLHRVLLDAPLDRFVDHRNHDTLDNRKENLRLATHRQNMRNARRRVDNASGFRGVTARIAGRWRAQISNSKRRVHLGTFATAEDAARAYDDAARRLYSDFALLNFPEAELS